MKNMPISEIARLQRYSIDPDCDMALWLRRSGTVCLSPNTGARAHCLMKTQARSPEKWEFIDFKKFSKNEELYSASYN